MSADCISAQELFDYSLGRLAQPIRCAVEAHVLECDTCAARLAGEGPFDDAVREAVDNVVPPAILRRLKRIGEKMALDAEGSQDDRGA